MRYNYKTQELIDKGVDFATIFPEKQTTVKEMTGFDFDLPNIVTFMKKETDGFAKEIPLALDLDKYIYSIYLKSQNKKTEPAKTTPATQPSGGAKAEPTSKKTLETRLKIVKAMLKKSPDSSILKTRIKIIEKQLKA